MATGLTKNTTIVGIAEEVTEGTYVAPASVNAYIQPLSEGFEISPSRDKIDRNILTNSIGKVTPRLGMKAVQASLPVEMRASGVEGGDVDFSLLLETALGAKRSVTTNTTTKASGNTGSVLQIDDADIGKYTLNDIILVKQTGGHHVSPISAIDTTPGAANVTLLRAKASGSFANSVVISKVQMFLTANSGHKSLSLSYYHGNEIRETSIGSKVASMSLEGFTTGQVPSLNFALEGLNYDQVNGAAPHTPSYDSGLPPIILGAFLYQDGVSLDCNEVSLSLTNSLTPLTAFNSLAGKTKQRVIERVITGTFNPFKDDTSVANFTAFNAGTEFSMLLVAGNPTSTPGEFEMGSVVAIYLPKCILTSIKAGDIEGIMIDDLAFQAVRGSAGTTEEMYLGLI